MPPLPNAPLAQLVEQLTLNQLVQSSNPNYVIEVIAACLTAARLKTGFVDIENPRKAPRFLNHLKT